MLRCLYAGMVCLGIAWIPASIFAQANGKNAVKETPVLSPIALDKPASVGAAGAKGDLGAGGEQKSLRKPGKKKPSIPVVLPESKKDPAVLTPPAASKNAGGNFAELSFNKTLVIEGKVEKPQVQFTLLKEPPPEKEIRFETSFMPNILKLDRENTFKVGETYGRE